MLMVSTLHLAALRDKKYTLAPSLSTSSTQPKSSYGMVVEAEVMVEVVVLVLVLVVVLRKKSTKPLQLAALIVIAITRKRQHAWQPIILSKQLQQEESQGMHVR